MGPLDGTARRLGQLLPPSADRERQCVDAEAPASILEVLRRSRTQVPDLPEALTPLLRALSGLARGYSPTVILADEPEAEAPRVSFSNQASVTVHSEPRENHAGGICPLLPLCQADKRNAGKLRQIPVCL